MRDVIRSEGLKLFQEGPLRCYTLVRDSISAHSPRAGGILVHRTLLPLIQILVLFSDLLQGSGQQVTLRQRSWRPAIATAGPAALD